MLMRQVPAHQSLKTVVMTDVAGFTEVMRENEPKALPLLRADIELITSHIEQNGGEIVKIAGDGILALFSSAPRAVRACIDSQESLLNSPLKHRMAIHAGEITRTDGDAYGDAINVCARIEAITTPGTVSASRIVMDLIEAQGLPDPTKRSKVQLKGIDNAVEVFCWGHTGRSKIHFPKGLLIGTIVAMIALMGSALAWQLKGSRHEDGGFELKRPSRLVAHANNGESEEAPNVDELLDQAFDDVWQEIDAYDAVKADAIKRVDAKLAIQWLENNALGKRDRGRLELEHWGLIDQAITKGQEYAGKNANAEQIWAALAKHNEPGLALAKNAFAEEFRRPR